MGQHAYNDPPRTRGCEVAMTSAAVLPTGIDKVSRGQLLPHSPRMGTVSCSTSQFRSTRSYDARPTLCRLGSRRGDRAIATSSGTSRLAGEADGDRPARSSSKHASGTLPIRKAADPSESANNARAQNYLGTTFFEGRGVARDLEEAVKWFQRGARQGNVEACQNLGTCYEAGLGVAKDVPKAIELFRRAVQGGSVSASSKLAYLLARDALHTLAAIAPRYYSLNGVALSFRETSWGLVQGGENNHCDKSKKVLGETSEAQLREAADLFRRAADNGIADASYQLGRLYQQGLGIPHDPVAAFENFRAAADSPVGHPTAAACVGDMLYTGAGCSRDRARAFTYYVRAAKAGEATSANAVGLMFELGRGVKRDALAAGAWYEKAADLGCAEGAYNAALLLERGDPLSMVALAAGVYPPEKPSVVDCVGSSDVAAKGKGLPCLMTPPSAEDRNTGSFEAEEATKATSGGRGNNAEGGEGGVNGGTRPADGSRGEVKVRAEGRAWRKQWEGGASKEGGSCQDGCHLHLPRHAMANSWALREDPKAALRMFERAEELGHPGARKEIYRLRLRERMDLLVAPATKQQGYIGAECKPEST